MAMFLGGTTWPIGWHVGFLNRPYSEVVDATRAWGRVEHWVDSELPAMALPERLQRLAPLQMPPKRELVLPAGERWTARLDNGLDGGDSVSWVGQISSVLGCQGVLATHIPIGQYAFPCTMFELVGPDGPPPLHYIRSITAGIFDNGRWHFDLHGKQLPFEEPDAYSARRKRDRFIRPMLVRYLAALGIMVDDPEIYGRASTLIESRGDYESRAMTITQARAEYATTDRPPSGEFP